MRPSMPCTVSPSLSGSVGIEGGGGSLACHGGQFIVAFGRAHPCEVRRHEDPGHAVQRHEHQPERRAPRVLDHSSLAAGKGRGLEM
jgi:hypothetical protein